MRIAERFKRLLLAGFILGFFFCLGSNIAIPLAFVCFFGLGVIKVYGGYPLDPPQAPKEFHG